STASCPNRPAVRTTTRMPRPRWSIRHSLQRCRKWQRFRSTTGFAFGTTSSAKWAKSEAHFWMRTSREWSRRNEIQPSAVGHQPRERARGSPGRQFMKNLLWHHLPCNDDEAAALAGALGVHPIIARLLCLRGLSNVDDATRFLNPSL